MNRTFAREERGQITVLIMGFAVVLVMFVGVVVNASHVFLERRALSSWADGAVTTATQQVAYDRIYGGDRLDRLPVSEAAARDAVISYIADHEVEARFDRFSVTEVDVDPDGRVTVAFAAVVPLVGMGDFGPPISLSADASAAVPLD